MKIQALLSIALMLVVGCGRNAGAIAPIFPEEIVASWGYRTIETGFLPQSDWEKENFGEAEVRYQWIKGIDELKDWEGAYYRFRITEEVFATQEQTEKRVERIGDSPPGQHTKMHPHWTLCDGRSSENSVYIVSTDSTKFEEEALPGVIANVERHLEAQTNGKEGKRQPP